MKRQFAFSGIAGSPESSGFSDRTLHGSGLPEQVFDFQIVPGALLPYDLHVIVLR